MLHLALIRQDRLQLNCLTCTYTNHMTKSSKTFLCSYLNNTLCVSRWSWRRIAILSVSSAISSGVPTKSFCQVCCSDMVCSGVDFLLSVTRSVSIHMVILFGYSKNNTLFFIFVGTGYESSFIC